MINDRTIEVRREFEGRIEELSDELIMKEQLLETKTKVGTLLTLYWLQ